MKSNLIKYALMSIVALGFWSCAAFEDAEPELYTGSDFVAFLNTTEAITIPEVTAAPVTFPIEVSSAQTGPVSVQLNISAVGAVSGVDYDILSPNPLVIAPGDYFADFEIQVYNNNLSDPERTITVEIASVTGASGVDVGLAEAGSLRKVFTIADDDCPDSPSCKFWGAVTGTDVGFGNYACTASAGANVFEVTINGDLGGGCGAGNPDCEYPVVMTLVPGADPNFGTIAPSSGSPAYIPFGGYTYDVIGGTYDLTTLTLNWDYAVYRFGGLQWTGSYIIQK